MYITALYYYSLKKKRHILTDQWHGLLELMACSDLPRAEESSKCPGTKQLKFSLFCFHLSTYLPPCIVKNAIHCFQQ